MTAAREVEIRRHLERIDRTRIMHAGDPWTVFTAARDLLAEVERLRRLVPSQGRLALEVG